MTTIRIDTRMIFDSASFHDVFAREFGFPSFYGRNMDAWIDCMSYLDEIDAGMSTIHVAPGETLFIELAHAKEFERRCPYLLKDLVKCTEVVNARQKERVLPPLLELVIDS